MHDALEGRRTVRSVIAAGRYSSRWARLIPIAFITYSLAYVDRANYSFGAAGGMAQA
jgi:hypothetical protein